MATDEKKQTIRDKVQRESLELGKKQRFGMFSIPISNAIGDNSYDQVKTFKKGPEPRNFTTNFAKKGQIDTVLFSKPDYITIGDPYQEPLKQQMKGSKSTANIKGVHQFNFQPAKTFQRKVKSDYEYIPEYNENTKSRRMPGGVVVLEPKNFMTSPPKRGQVGKQTTFSGQIEYLPDPYDNKRQLEKIERLQHLKKIPHKPFTQKVIGKETFSTIQDTYGGNFPLSPEKIQRQSKFEVKHDVPFMPSNYPKKGYNKTIGKFPEYKEDPQFTYDLYIITQHQIITTQQQKLIERDSLQMNKLIGNPLRIVGQSPLHRQNPKIKIKTMNFPQSLDQEMLSDYYFYLYFI